MIPQNTSAQWEVLSSRQKIVDPSGLPVERRLGVIGQTQSSRQKKSFSGTRPHNSPLKSWSELQETASVVGQSDAESFHLPDAVPPGRYCNDFLALCLAETAAPRG